MNTPRAFWECGSAAGLVDILIFKVSTEPGQLQPTPNVCRIGTARKTREQRGTRDRNHQLPASPPRVRAPVLLVSTHQRRTRYRPCAVERVLRAVRGPTRRPTPEQCSTSMKRWSAG